MDQPPPVFTAAHLLNAFPVGPCAAGLFHMHNYVEDRIRTKPALFAFITGDPGMSNLYHAWLCGQLARTDYFATWLTEEYMASVLIPMCDLFGVPHGPTRSRIPELRERYELAFWYTRNFRFRDTAEHRYGFLRILSPGGVWPSIMPAVQEGLAPAIDTLCGHVITFFAGITPATPEELAEALEEPDEEDDGNYGDE